jgi:type IV conjugative transfer system coupling protein TraD
MSRINRGRGEAWLRGGQTVGHTWDMVLEVLGRLLIVAIIWGALCVWMGNSKSSDLEQTYGIQGLQAAAFHKFGNPFPQKISIKDLNGVETTYDNAEVANIGWLQPYAQAYYHNQRIALLIWIFGCIAIAILATLWFVHSGQEKLKARQIRGQYVVSLTDLIKQILTFNAETVTKRKLKAHVPAKLAGVPYPFETEQEHTFCAGSTGAGKTQALHSLLESVRARGDRAIIYDPDLDYIRTHYNPDTDLILNPYDERSIGWDPFNDAHELHEFEKLAACLFKEPKGADPYWTKAPRGVFIYAAYKLKRAYPDAALGDLLRVLFGPIELIMHLLQGTPAFDHVSGGKGQRTDSIKSVLADGVAPLIHMTGRESAFSIKRWVNDPERQGGFLFLSAPETHIESLRPLLGFCTELTMSALLSRDLEFRPTTWLFFDEVASLGKVDALALGPERIRKFGGALVLGLQQVSQLQETYGHEITQTIIGQCATKLILRCQDPDTAKWMSEQLGRAQMRRVDETVSYGANSQRDGVGVTPREELEPVALPEDVMNQPKLQGFIKVSNARDGTAFPIATIKFAYKSRPQIAEGIVPLTGPLPVESFFERNNAEQARLAAAEDLAPDATEPAAPAPETVVINADTGEVIEGTPKPEGGGMGLKDTEYVRAAEMKEQAATEAWTSNDTTGPERAPRSYILAVDSKGNIDNLKARVGAQAQASAFERLYAQVRRDMEAGVQLNGLAVWKGKPGTAKKGPSQDKDSSSRGLDEDEQQIDPFAPSYHTPSH